MAKKKVTELKIDKAAFLGVDTPSPTKHRHLAMSRLIVALREDALNGNPAIANEARRNLLIAEFVADSVPGFEKLVGEETDAEAAELKAKK